PLVLHGIVLRRRPRRSADLYRKIWTPEGSPLLVITRRIAERLRARLPGVRVAVGMRYGKPSIDDALRELEEAGCRRLLLFPLYPQYSASTTASTVDALSRALSRRRVLPELRTINGYHDAPEYVRAVAQGVRGLWSAQGRAERLLFSFHGLPRRYVDAGDPYAGQCHATARLVAEALELRPGDWSVSFQSRFGREEWLTPYTDETLRQLRGVGVDVVCPGFPADCLETLEEIAIQNRELFRAAGGGAYRYVPALNDAPHHVEALASLVRRAMSGWPGVS
ncbi:MAG: ferrochelatase, partial [Planctomycetota bacterium]